MVPVLGLVLVLTSMSTVAIANGLDHGGTGQGTAGARGRPLRHPAAGAGSDGVAGSGAGAGREEGGQDVVVDVGGPALGRRRGLVPDDLAEGHLVEPALAAVRAEHLPVGAGPLEELDLVALVELADVASSGARRVRRGGARRGTG